MCFPKLLWERNAGKVRKIAALHSGPLSHFAGQVPGAELMQSHLSCVSRDSGEYVTWHHSDDPLAFLQSYMEMGGLPCGDRIDHDLSVLQMFTGDS